MYESPEGNQVRLSASITKEEWDGYTIEVASNVEMTQDDAYLSHPVNGRLHMTTPAATDLIPTWDLDVFK
jgi:hypothetical protein